MKRSTPLARKSRLARTTRLRKVNPDAHARRVARYRAGLAKARRGPGYRAAMERSAGRCEHTYERTHDGVTWVDRCTMNHGLQAHHLTYARFGGKELPEDYLVVCAFCHAELESDHPTRRHGRAG